ncbi:helix-turn-helix domain-containing protein [Achromobacter sp. Marseille-Q0513]|uniref:IclR family transcriptional regulator n=1 Tax=Achromobacter sp. Marseille-Q0513 TaxID=2829161 RepID=UPI001B91D732|nr:IclR family transcriptional regulator C-terminal domain-containing protein [Achromobacter sp. Marseille-Q0513]MBR8657574.1 helix-turn-helix domain-containing protein [Achromobacter sp. Marseille-Q0513]
MSSSLARAFDVLDLFTLETSRLTSEEVSARLGYSRSMAYRYLKELCDAGLLVPQSGGQYGLGPRIIELERLVALTDPLYLAGRAVLKGRSREDSAYLLQNLYEDKVLCIYKEGPDVLEHAGRRTVILRARGQPFPLFQGSGSLALLAFLPHHRIRQAYLRSAQAIAAAGLGEDWAAFRRALAAIRKAGYAISHEQIAPGLGGVAVPILLPDDGALVGSLAWSFPIERMEPDAEARWARELARVAAEIAREYVAQAGRPAH